MKEFVKPGFDFLIYSCKRKYIYLKYIYLIECTLILPVTQGKSPTLCPRLYAYLEYLPIVAFYIYSPCKQNF